MKSNPARILLVTPELEYTGAVQSFRRICIVLLRNGYLIDVWSYADGPYSEEFRDIGVRVRIVPQEDIDEAYIAREVTKYNLVLANTVVTYKVADMAQDLVPVVWYIREAENLPDFFWKKERETALCRAKKVYSVSEYARDFIVRNYNPNVEVVHNCVDDVFCEEGSYLEIRPGEKIKFLALGTIEKRKGYDILVDAFLDLPRAVKEKCELHFAGRLWDGARDFYPELLSKIKTEKNIFYHGEIRERKEIHALINACHVLVVPSRDESCSLSALEGAMMARPLILTQNIGAKYILDETCGWLIQTADISTMRQAYIHAFESAGRLSEMGRCARENYLRTSTYEIYEQNILKMVRDRMVPSQYLYRVRDEIELYSFDVFQTLLARCYARPDGVFIDMQATLCRDGSYAALPGILRENFAKIRKTTERFLYRKRCSAEKQDVSIQEIYALIAQDFALDQEEQDSLLELEIAIDRESLLPLERNIDLVRRLSERKKRVILITDMYFDAQTIRGFLCKFEPMFESIPIYVSSEHQCKKNNGKLYELVQRQEKVPYEKWLHFGDDWNGDYLQPRKLGIQANYAPFARLLPYEAGALDRDSGLQTQTSIGLARYLRAGANLDRMTELGVSLGGAMLYPYASWLVERSRKSNIRKLYFIARDGYVLKKIVDERIAFHQYTIETEYLYGSRIAWRDAVREGRQAEIDLVKRYLAQEINGEEVFAFVDFAGTGETQDAIFPLLDRQRRDLCYGTFYLYHSRDPQTQSSPKYSMLRLNEQFHTLLELLVRAPHGQTLGYREEEGKIVPVLEQKEGAALEAAGYPRYVDGVVRFVRAYLELSDAHRRWGDCQEITLFERYSAYLQSPDIDPETVETLGSIPFVLDGAVGQVTEYAPRITPEQVDSLRDSGRENDFGNRLSWSIKRSSPEVQKAFQEKPQAGRASGRDELAEAIRRYQRAEQELQDIRASRTYKVGRMITFIPRKIRDMVRCSREYGVGYTLRTYWKH